MSNMDHNENSIIISAGGTGGHMSPAAALAHNLIARGYRIVLMTDDRGVRYKNMFAEDVAIHVVRSGTAGAGIIGKIKGAYNLARGIMHALKTVKSIKPLCVVGFGGYPSFPGVYAAQKLKIPTILHEQNATIGKANLCLSPQAERIALSMPYMNELDRIDQLRCVITGNPVRSEVSALYDSEYPKFTHDSDLNILVMGGSLGATVFSHVVPKALATLSPEYRARLKVVQQCRAADIEHAREVYQKEGIDATLSTFIDDIAGAFERAHFVIGRSGASTVAEVSVAGRPAIYVPYPHHKDQQQKKNAESVAESGGAWIMTEDAFNPEILTERITLFFQNPDILLRAAAKTRECAKPHAARKLGNLVVAISKDLTKY